MAENETKTDDPRSLERIVRPIAWTLERSNCNRFDFMVGKISGKIFFTAGPVMLDGSGGWDLRCFLRGDSSVRVKEGDDPKEIARVILESHARELLA